MSYEKDKLDSFVTSASLSTALAPYVTSNSLSAAIAGISFGEYVTSNSLSAAVATNALTVRGTASVSATLSAGAVTVAGRPVGAVMVSYQTFTNVTSFSFSGSWSDFAVLQIYSVYRMNGSASASVAIFTDGGTSAILSGTTAGNIDTGAVQFEANILGTDGRPDKYMVGIWRTVGGLGGSTVTLTANAGFVNCFRMSASRTISNGMAVLYGWRKA